MVLAREPLQRCCDLWWQRMVAVLKAQGSWKWLNQRLPLVCGHDLRGA